MGSLAVFTGCDPSGAPATSTGTQAGRLVGPHPALEEATIAGLQAEMEAGRLTARTLVEQYLARIQAVDEGAGGVNAIIEVNPDALALAEALDQERAEQGPRGPLHGIPVVLKDNIDTADQMATTAGSTALAGHRAAQDAWVTERLRAAGAVILAKANLSEWANFRSTNSSSGWSGRGGLTRNPYVLDRNPCGSSSGSGAAVAANLCAAAIGTETNGSVVCPSSANGVVGIKPTVGLVGRSGIIPISHTQDTAGPMARTVRDAALLLGALTGTDPRDAVTQESEGQAHTDYTSFLDAGGLRGARIGVARNFFGFDDRVDALLEEALAAMEAQGAILVDPANITTMGDYGRAGLDVLLYEFKHDLNAYLETVDPSIPHRTLADLIAYNEAHAEVEMPFFRQELFVMAQDKGPLTDEAYQEALATCLRLSREEGIDATLAEHNLDAIVGPTGGPAWVTDLVNGDSFGGGSSTPAARAGYPNITVPAGFVMGLPVGISFFAGAYSEPTLLRLAYAFEQATQHRAAPTFIPTLKT